MSVASETRNGTADKEAFGSRMLASAELTTDRPKVVLKNIPPIAESPAANESNLNTIATTVESPSDTNQPKVVFEASQVNVGTQMAPEHAVMGVSSSYHPDGDIDVSDRRPGLRGGDYGPHGRTLLYTNTHDRQILRQRGRLGGSRS